MHSVLDKPMTIKIRIGRDEKNPTVHKNIVPYVHLWGASALTVRSATAHQRDASAQHTAQMRTEMASYSPTFLDSRAVTRAALLEGGGLVLRGQVHSDRALARHW